MLLGSLQMPEKICLLSLQFFSCGIVLVSISMGFGAIYGFSAIHLPQMEDEGIREAKSEEASWIGQLFS